MIVTIGYQRSETDTSRNAYICRVSHFRSKNKQWVVDLYKFNDHIGNRFFGRIAGAQACARKWVE